MPEPHQPARPRPTPTPRMVLCPFCGSLTASMERCGRCGGRFDPLSRQASQNAMGPWFVRDEARAFLPGCSYDTIRQLITRSRIRPTTVLRGPTTNQFWTLAKRTPGVAHLLGICHNCEAVVEPSAYACASCGAVFGVDADRQHLGLAPMQMLPGEAPPAVIAAMSGPPLATEPLEVTRSNRPGVESRRTRQQTAPIPTPQPGPTPPAAPSRPASRRWLAAAVLLLALVAGAGLAAGALYAAGLLRWPAEAERRAPSEPPPEAPAAPTRSDSPAVDAGPSEAPTPERGGGAAASDADAAPAGGSMAVIDLLREDSEAALGTALEQVRISGVPGSGRRSEPGALEEAVRLRLAQRDLRRIP